MNYPQVQTTLSGIDLSNVIINKSSRRILLSVLYIAEGSKTIRKSLMFGNSDPYIIKLFLVLLRSSFEVDESKFRCTVQCRADQNTEELCIFWSKVTNIPIKQFYKPQIDKRTQGKPTQKTQYKGVCRIDYFSSSIETELKNIIKDINNYLGPVI